MTTPAPAPSTQSFEPGECLIVVGCSRRKLVTSAPVEALELYQGSCIPHLRGFVAGDPARRSRIRILSALHGLLRAEDRIVSYDRRLNNDADARCLETRVRGQLDAELASSPALAHVLILVEDPLYLIPLERLFDHLNRLKLILICTPKAKNWQSAFLVLQWWGWL
jgi:hypothetical protein